jgi:stage II sporulation protein M
MCFYDDLTSNNPPLLIINIKKMVKKGDKIMADNKLMTGIIRHVQTNFWLYIISILCLCIGIVLGIYTVGYMSSFEKSDLLSYMQSFCSSIATTNINSQTIIFESIKNNLTLLAAIWFLGLTMIGIPIILLLEILKGFTIGYTTCFIINGLGVKGIWISLLGILPQNIIYIPCLIFSSVLAMDFSITMLKSKESNKYPSLPLRITSYSFAFVFICIFMFLGFLIEAYLTPNMLKLTVINYGSVFS